MPEFHTIASRVVSIELQEQFANFSGDRNPMHMDPLAARRTQAGLPVVHGVHTLLWALECLTACNYFSTPFCSIQVKFVKWVYLGDEATLSVPTADTKDLQSFQVDVLGMPVLTAHLFFEPQPEPPPASPATSAPAASTPAAPLSAARELAFAALEHLSGDAVTPSLEAARAFFPKLTALLGAGVAEIAACSYIVGMEAPGLHSMFSNLDLTLVAAAAPGPVHYAVVSHDRRFRKVRLAVTGRALSGALNAFVRVPPVEQASMALAAQHVAPDEFANMRALIVGGSRGLGELTAKLIAAGGGIPTITYALGKLDAQRVAAQIGAWGSQANALAYDVRRSPAAQLPQPEPHFTHLFYFATNAIFRPKKDLVSPPILADFIAFYLQGFHDLCVYLTRPAGPVAQTNSALAAYYPSSIAVEERPAGMTEYAMAKAAGEEMCKDMNAHLPHLRILTTRLPRLPTDQTAGLIPERALDPLQVILPIVRAMQALPKAGPQTGYMPRGVS
jgi:acyl dehydratase